MINTEFFVELKLQSSLLNQPIFFPQPDPRQSSSFLVRRFVELNDRRIADDLVRRSSQLITFILL